MGISRGPGIKKLQAKAERRGESLKRQGARALEITVEEAAVELQDLLEAAVTPTGRRRETQRGGFPGRHESGNMVGSVSWELRNLRAKVIQGVFGWWGGNYEDYFRWQDDPDAPGRPGNIPAARALPQAYMQAREKLRRRLADIAQGKSVE